MAIIDAMRTFAKDEPEQKPSRQDRAWDDLGNTLYEVGHAETPNEIDQEEQNEQKRVYRKV